jgi:hypothetical protein
MSQPPERDEASPPEPAAGQDATLSRPIQEHLGKELRTTYRVEAPEKPAYLGDPVLPVEFELLLQRLEVSERERIRQIAHEQGIEAVERALRELLPGSAAAGDA